MCKSGGTSAGSPEPRADGAGDKYKAPTKQFLTSYKMPPGETSIYPFKTLREYALNMQLKDPVRYKQMVADGTFGETPAPIEEPDPTMYQRQGNPLNRSDILFNQDYQKELGDYYRINSEVDQVKASKMRNANKNLERAIKTKKS